MQVFPTVPSPTTTHLGNLDLKRCLPPPPPSPPPPPPRPPLPAAAKMFNVHDKERVEILTWLDVLTTLYASLPFSRPPTIHYHQWGFLLFWAIRMDLKISYDWRFTFKPESTPVVHILTVFFSVALFFPLCFCFLFLCLFFVCTSSLVRRFVSSEVAVAVSLSGGHCQSGVFHLKQETIKIPDFW